MPAFKNSIQRIAFKIIFLVDPSFQCKKKKKKKKKCAYTAAIGGFLQ